jgi:hypothetical protein
MTCGVASAALNLPIVDRPIKKKLVKAIADSVKPDATSTDSVQRPIQHHLSK